MDHANINKDKAALVCRGRLVLCEGGAPLLDLGSDFGVQYFDDVREPAEEAVANTDDVNRDRSFVGDLSPDVSRVVLVPERVVSVCKNTTLFGVDTIRAVITAAAILAGHGARQDLVLRERRHAVRNREPSEEGADDHERERAYPAGLIDLTEEHGKHDRHDNESRDHDEITRHGSNPPKCRWCNAF